MEGKGAAVAALVSLAVIFLCAGVFFSPPERAARSPALPPSREGPKDGAPSGAARTLRVLMADASVETLALEDYVEGVLRLEMPASFESAALEAQAVCARTYALRRQGQGPHSPQADVCADPTCCQAYSSLPPESWGAETQVYAAKLHAAVQATAGQVLTQDGGLIDAVFHASSSGFTAPAQAVWGTAVPYLVSVPTPETPDAVSGLQQEFSFTDRELAELLGPGEVGLPIYADWGGVEALTVGERAFSGVEVRQKLGLRSARFQVERRGEETIFLTTGYGHGVGLSQQGANLLAKEGADCAQILAHYYPGTTLEHR